MINLWRNYPKCKPKKAGKYLCTVRYGSELENTKVMDLYFDTIDGGRWIDDRRQNVFDGYKVYVTGRIATEDNRVYTDALCERSFVSAWKKMPRGYKENRRKLRHNEILN